MANKPIILTVDDDMQVLNAIKRDLRSQYKKEYRILSTASAGEALAELENIKAANDTVALFLSDQRMPEMLGVEFLEKAKTVFPEAKRVLLTAYSDTDAAIKAINDVQLDYYLMKPWDPPTEKLFPVLDGLLADWELAYVPEFAGIRMVGYQYSPKSHLIKDFLAGNLIPYRWYEVGSDPKAQELVAMHGLETKDLPTVVLEDGDVLRNPDILELGNKIGMQSQASQRMYDVVVIGAGPSGLAAAVYGASEGLKTLLIERRAPGGQAGTSSRIENYLGFPNGLSGSELTNRAVSQARRLGAEFLSPQAVSNITLKDKYKLLTLADGSEINAKSVIVTTGVEYRHLESPGVANFTGAGVYYGAATTEAHACRNSDVYIVGGGNSAGQGAVYLSKFARNVYIVIRRDSLTSSMSAYLIEQIDNIENIHLVPNTQVAEAKGSDHLESLVLEDRNTKEQREVEAVALFIFIGAKPATDWLLPEVLKDKRGFVITGRDLQHNETFKAQWKVERDPYAQETSVPGIFAAGDVRSGAMNRVASAVGEGAMAIKLVHQYLAEN